MKTDNKDTIHELKPLEITSPRTAEQPSPKLSKSSKACCDTCEVDDTREENQAAAQVSAVSTEEEAEASYAPTIISLLLLLSGIALDYFDVAWFTSYIRPVWFGVAYVLVGWRVVWHAFQNITRGSIFVCARRSSLDLS